jgi:putative FmdB family regulatory protein
MPTYEYACRECGHHFEAWQHMTDDPLTVCPKCNGSIHRVLFPAGIVFKGSGFYKTEYGSKGSAGASHTTESKSSDSGESKSNTDSGKSENTSSTSSSTATAAD